MNKQNIEDIISLTPLQEGILYHYLSEPESGQYFEQLSLVLSGEINVEAVKRAWQFVADTNEMLRTVFRWDKLEKPVQIILKEYKIPVMEYDFSGIPDREKLIRELKESDRKRKIDIACEPMRIMLCRLEENKYEMIISNHHIIYDGWSSGIILKELFEVYHCICSGKEPGKTEKNKFKEFIKWRLKQDKGRQENYWREYLKNFEKQTAAAIDSKNRVYGSIPETYKHTLTEKLVNRIYEFTKEKQITLASLFYGAWGIVLQRYNNTDDVIFGTTVSGRSAKINGIEEMAGLFINTIPLRINLEQSCSAIDFINSIGRDLKDREEYESTSLADINSYSGINGNGSLFDSIVVIENYPLEKRLKDAGSKLKVEAYEMFEMTNYDMTLGVKLFDGIELDFCYREGAFEAEAVKRRCGHFVNILKSIMENADAGVCELKMPSEDERQQLLYDFNNTESEYESDKTIFELFEEQAERIPEQVAVKVTASEEITYGELDKKSNRLAVLLRAKGVKPNSIVGIMAERSIEMLVGIMGILKSGGAYLPIDPEYPEDRIRYMLEDSEAFMLLAQGMPKDRVNFDGEVLELMAEDTYPGEGYSLEKVNSPNDLAYVIYTSGTTGKPKGVMVEHRSISNAIQWRRKKYGLDTSDNVLQLFSFVFDGFLTSFFTPVVSGSKVVLLRDEEAKDPVCIKNKIRDEGITHFIAVPGLYSAILEASGKEELESLKKVALAGDKVTEDLLERSRGKNDRLEIINEYGPTEGSVVVTASEDIGAGDRITIGKPIDNVQVYILDRNNNLQPQGIYGELCISGGGLARGYLNRPDLTSEKFVQNPFVKGARLYKTGDLSRWLPDGNIEFAGRTDNQVKIRGFRIEPGEVENRLLSHEHIKEAVVAAKEGSEGSKQLCAYITGEKELTVKELREFLRRSLADYMIPSYFIQIDKMPLTPNGKVDRKALPEPCGSIETGTEYEAPRDEVEEKLAAIWQEVLKVRRVGINDSFFELGGHSLKATGMAGKIHKELSVEVPVKEVFKTPTIKGLAEYIKGQKPSIYETIQPVEEREYYPVSPAQKRIYTLQKLDSGSTSYNMPGVFIVEGDLEHDKLESAFKALVSRHESLRTSFELMGNEIVQRIYKNAELKIEYFEHKEEEVQERIKSFLKPFDLSKAPLIRAGIVRLMDESSKKRYLLLLDIHHIIADGTSIGILTREFGELYKGRSLKELRLQYKDFAAWQSDILNREEVKRQGEYWISEYSKGAAAREIPVLNLPTDYPRPAIQSFEGSSARLSLDKELTRKLKRIAKETGATMYMVLLAAFNILLSKYSRQEDIIVGSPIAGRHHADLENIIGMFVNTLAVRNYPEGKKTYGEFLKEVKERMLKAYENQDYQFEELVEKLDIKRDLSRNPLFDVMFAMQNMDIGKIELEGASIEPYEMKSRISKFDLTVFATETDEIVELEIEYCTGMFKKDTIERLGRHFINILEQVSDNLAVKLEEIDMTEGEEKQLVLYGFNDTDTEYPREKTVSRLFEEQAVKTPDNTAAVYEGQRLTYRELNEKANQLAAILRKEGVKPNSVVGMMMERTPEFIAGMLGIIKAGAAFVALDPEYPGERIKYMLEDSGVKVLIVQKELKDKLSFEGCCIHAEEITGFCGERRNPEALSTADDLLYIVYTSGSTGKPKGIMIEHRTIVNLIHFEYQKIDIDFRTKVLQFAASSFDVCYQEIFSTLLCGGELHIINTEKKKNAEELMKFIEDREIEIVFLPTAYVKYISSQEEIIRKLPKRVKHIITAGEQLIVNHNLRRSITENGICLHNHYGPSEAHAVTTYEIRAGKCIDEIPLIGKPISNTRIYILDDRQKPLPIGIPGELYISGDCVGRGYISRPELTALKFLENPFIPGEKMYRTGDLARWCEDGNIEYLGRVDHQVKIRGYRIEPGEIENLLIKHEAVKEALVIVREEQNYGNYLCAYMVAEREVSTSEIREYLRDELPDYMIPSYFIQLDKIPLTVNGKVDRALLPEPDRSIATGAYYEAPGNEIEEKLAAIWQEVLGAEKIGVGDSFFELGGHSLKATVMTAMVHRELGIEIPLREVFKEPTIKGLSQYMRKQEKLVYKPIEPVQEREYYEISSAQKRIYTTQQLDNDGTGYNMPAVFEIKGSPDIVRIRKVFTELIERHEAFRTSFELCGGEIVQKIHESAELKAECIQVKEGTNIEALISSFVRPFDLGKAPLLRVMLIETMEERYFLLLDMHHVIADGTSIAILTREFGRLYKGDSLPELMVQYKDYAAWQNKLLKEAVIAKQEEYWLNRYEGEIPVLYMPVDYLRPAVQSFKGADIKFQTDEKLTAKLKEIAERMGVTLYMLLLAGFNILLSKYSGQEDIVVGSPIAGRQHADTENTIGMFVNTLAMRNMPEGRKRFEEFLREVRENALRAYENQDYQFEELVEKVAVKRDLSRNPLFDVMFAMQNQDIYEIELEGLCISPYEMQNTISKFDITLTAEEKAGRIGFRMQYCTQLYRKETIERMAGHFINILSFISENTGSKLSEIDMLCGEEQHRLLYEFNNTYAEYPKDKTIYELFEEQAAMTPDNIAAVYEDKQLSYRELNEKANRLARVLREKGVVPDSIAGIMVERSIEMIIGILGILKAGGAYLPIDHEYPADRIRYMLEDSDASILLIQKQTRGKADFNGEILEIDDELLYEGDRSNLETVNSPNDLAYIIYTSGTTGKPKGAMIEHKNVVRLMFNDKMQFNFNDKDVWTMFHSYCFDFSVWEMYGALLYGGKLVVIPKPVAQEPGEFLKVLIKEKVTVLNQTPSAFYKLIEAEEDYGNNALRLRYVIFGGEALKPAMLKGFYAKYPSVKLINMYGITETTVHVTYKEISGDEIEAGISNIGRPIPTLTAYVMDKSMRLLPAGLSGELCIGGEGVCRGYLNRPLLTTEKFVVNPYKESERLYRSGDLVRLLPDGDIEYLGRIDHQVKIRGYRIELGEVEEALRKYPNVKDSVVLCKSEADDKTYLTAYIVTDNIHNKVFEGKQRFRLPNNMYIAHINRNETEFMYKEIFEEQNYLQYGIDIKPGDCILDVGANIGMFTLFVNHICSDVRVYSFEPIPSVYEVLKINTSIYAKSSRAFNFGLSDRSGTEIFTFYPRASVMSGCYVDIKEDKELFASTMDKDEIEYIENHMEDLLEDRFEKQEVACRLKTLSEVIHENGLEKVDLLKIDVEKSEMDVLKGIRDEDWYKIKQLVIEVHEIDGKVDKIVHLLESHGYSVFVGGIDTFIKGGLYTIYAILNLSEDIKRSIEINGSGKARREIAVLEDSVLTAGELRNFLKQSLPEYMIPSYFVQLQKLPMTPNGKLDRKALAGLDGSLEAGAEYEAPRNEMEEKLVGIWQEVLGANRIGIDDNFFDLGGHSLKGVQVVNMVYKELSTKISLRDIFVSPTIKGMAEIIKSKALISYSEIERLPEQEYYELSYPQQRLWIIKELEPDSTAYNMPGRITLHEKADWEVISRVFEKLSKRHEGLRTRFKLVEGRAVQVIDKKACFDKELIELLGTEAEKAEKRQRIFEEEAARLFDLEKGPLFRVKLVKAGEEEYDLIISLHHIISDGWSMEILKREFYELYEAYKAGRDYYLEELTVQYRDFAAWQNRLIKSGDGMREAKEYWQEQLGSEIPVLDMPVSYRNKQLINRESAAYRLVVGNETREKLKTLAKDSGASLFTVLTAGFSLFLSGITGQEDIMLGAACSGRDHENLRGVVGYFINTTVLRNRINREENLREYLKCVNENTLKALEYQNYPLELIIDELKIDYPKIPVFLNMPNMGESSREYISDKRDYHTDRVQDIKFDIVCYMTEYADGIELNCHYLKGLYKASRIENLMREYAALLDGIAAEPDKKLYEYV